MSFQELFHKYKSKKPEIVFEWNDQHTDAKGWVVINSLRNGAAGGGTRMRKGLTKEEVVSLAKVMEIKFAVCGPPIGGAKSGIDFDPADPRKNEVLKRWFAAVLPILKYYYGTGGDLNVDELRDVVPIIESLGLWHPQQGIVHGYLGFSEGKNVQILGQLRRGCEKIVKDKNYIPSPDLNLAVADLITGFGVSEAVLHYYNIFKQSSIGNKRAIIQGWGNVAAAAAYYLSQQGVKIVGIIDREGGLINKEGFSHEEIKDLFINKNSNKLPGKLIPFEEVNDEIWKLKSEIFIPAAASKIVTREQVDQMLSNGLEVISCGANVPFTDDQIFMGETAFYLDEKIGLIPDFIANCGMARTFAYLMSKNAKIDEHAIFEDVSDTIRNYLLRIKEIDHQSTKISEKALSICLNNLLTVG